MRFPALLLLLPSALLLGPAARAEVRLARIFGDHMVLQRETEAAVWGWAEPGESVRVRGSWSTDEESITAADDQGRWRTTIPTPAAGGPYELVAEGSSRVVLTDVLVGEVWLASGQSNMQWPLSACTNAAEAIAAADHPNLRLFTVPRTYSMSPREDLGGGSWEACTPETAPGFSAVAYFFGSELQAELGVPVGVVHTSWGGTPAEAWTSRATIERLGDFAPALQRIDAALADPAGGQTVEALQAAWWKTVQERDPGMTGGWAAGPLEEGEWTAANVPGTFADIGLGDFDGCVWYRRTVDVDPSWVGKELVLELGPVDDMDLTWLNGRLVGETRGDSRWQEPRRYVVPADAVRAGANELAVCAVDSGGLGSIGVAGNVRPAMRLFPEGDEGAAVPLEGAWKARAGASTADLGAFPRATWFDQNSPTGLHNAMVAPLVPFAARGVVWYQGESNRGRWEQYRRLFPAMIADWRAVFGRELTFLFVQIAPFGYGGDRGEAARLREAQELALALPRTGMAVTMDVGNPADIHPRDKEPVGHRLVLWALDLDYGRDVECSGPLYRAMVVVGNEARLSFAHADGGLAADGEPTCFTVAGADRVFHPAHARIEGETLVVWSDDVPAPVAVRHAWGAADQPNLKNAAGLPAPSFRSDRWPMADR